MCSEVSRPRREYGYGFSLLLTRPTLFVLYISMLSFLPGKCSLDKGRMAARGGGGGVGVGGDTGGGDIPGRLIPLYCQAGQAMKRAGQLACLVMLVAVCVGQYLGASWVKVTPDDPCFSYVSARNSPSHYCQVVNACNSTVFVYPVEHEAQVHLEVDLLNLACSPYTVDKVSSKLRESLEPDYDFAATELDYCVDIASPCCRQSDLQCKYGQLCNGTLSCNGKTATFYVHLTTPL